MILHGPGRTTSVHVDGNGGANSNIALFNADGSSDAVMDVEGWFG